jgi:YihY family inner membrane protein
MAQTAHARTKRLRKLVDLWRDLFRRHDLLTLGAAIALQALVAVVALAFLGIALLGAFGREDIWREDMGPAIKPHLLPAVYRGIDATVEKIFADKSAWLILFALVLTIWEVSRAVRASMTALSRIEDHEDDRPGWIRVPLAFGIAIALTACLVGAFLLVTVARGVGSGAWGIPVTIARWLAALTLTTIGFGVLVRFGPAERRPKKWASAGATLVVVTWVVQSLLFRVYVTDVADFKSASGTLSAFFLLTVYLYVAALVLLIGIELDELLRADLEHDESAPGVIQLVRGLF